MGLSRTVSEIDGDIIRKSQNFPTPLYFLPPLKVPLGIGYRRWVEKTRMMGYRLRKKFGDIFSRLDTIHQRDRRTERRATANTALTHSVAR